MAKDESIRVKVLALVVILLNYVDAILTMVATSVGIPEVNPVMAYLTPYPLLFGLTKISLVSACVWYLWHHRTHLLARVGMYLGALAYTLVVLTHAHGWLLVLQEL